MSPEEAVETPLMRSPSVSGVPVSIARSVSRRCARRAPPRVHSSQPPSRASAPRDAAVPPAPAAAGGYAALPSAAVRRVGARGLSIDPRWIPVVSADPETRYRNLRPSGRNVGARWLIWPAAGGVTVWGGL